ncbi:hypothetical protein D1872_238390 [compost metagenome]
MCGLIPQILILPGISVHAIPEFTAKIFKDPQVIRRLRELSGELGAGHGRVLQTGQRSGDIYRVRDLRIINNEAVQLVFIFFENRPIILVNGIRRF